MRGRVDVGSVVRVPLHGRRLRAFVTNMLDEPAVPNARPLSALVSPEPLFALSELELARWVADRYVTTLGVVLHDAAPGRYSAPVAAQALRTKPLPAPGWIDPTELFASRETVCVVPVSAQPELVAYAASVTAEAGKQVLVICPRVAIAESIATFIEGAAVLHGDQRPLDRAASWAGAAAGEVSVVVGGRAALLVPLPRLGLVVVASAHDPGLRAERTPRLHALVVARERAARAEVSFLATSPVPPLELIDAKVVEPRRTGGVRTEVVRPGKNPATERLLDVARSATDYGKDALVFVARVGGALRLRCVDCEWMAPSEGAPDVCPRCGGRLQRRGWGHSRVATAIESSGIDVPVVRLVRGDEIDAPPPPCIVVGTLAAAYNWPRPFGSVCVADADQLLGRQDFRAAERALGVLHELAAVLEPGGRFLVQTREPDHHAVQSFTRRSYRYFAGRELPLRKETGYPPYGVVVVVEIKPETLSEFSDGMRAVGAMVLGPLDGSRASSRLLVRARELAPLLGPLRAFALAHKGVRIEVDPVDVM
jgi:primosomal protein N' (replication factor Y)